MSHDTIYPLLWDGRTVHRGSFEPKEDSLELGKLRVSADLVVVLVVKNNPVIVAPHVITEQGDGHLLPNQLFGIWARLAETFLAYEKDPIRRLVLETAYDMRNVSAKDAADLGGTAEPGCDCAACTVKRALMMSQEDDSKESRH